jgi:hypothetical protein
MNRNKKCEFCNIEITPTNWSRHLRSQRHRENDPDQTIPIRRRGRPKTVQLHRVLKFRKWIFQEPNVRTITIKIAFISRLTTLEILTTRNFIDVSQFLNSIELQLETLDEILQEIII